MAVALLHDQDTAHDIVADIFATLLHTDACTMPTESYLMQAVRNRCLNEIRNKSIHERIAQGLFLDDNDYVTDSDWPDEQTLSAINAIIHSQLPEKCKKVIDLRFYDGLPFAEVAQEMGISQTAVFKHLRHAIITIRKKLTSNG